jgi:hypothetical protein
MGKHATSIDTQVLTRIKARGYGWVFTAGDFTDLGGNDAVRQALTRHAKAGTIKQIARGLYHYPRHDPQLGLLSPSDDAIADALKGRDSARIQVSGAHAANMLGISTQVPMRTVYLTDGAARKVQIGRRQIVLKRTTTRQMATAGRVSGAVIQALRWFGQRHVDDKMIATLRRNLSADHKKQLLADLRYAPAWIAAAMRKIAAP